MLSCAFCGQSNPANARHCVDCGKSLAAAPTAAPPAAPAAPAAPTAPTAPGAPYPPSHSPRLPLRRPSPGALRRSGPQPALAIVPPSPARPLSDLVTCSWCGNSIASALPFCPHCGRRTDAKLGAACSTCGATIRSELDSFCASCGTPVETPAKKPAEVKKTLVFSAKRRDVSTRLVVLDEDGERTQEVDIDQHVMTLGRGPCEIEFPHDEYLSPRHAVFAMRDGALFVRDLGSVNRTWIFLDEPYVLQDEDVLLIGSQFLHFRRGASHGDPGSTDDGTRRIGSLAPSPDVATLSQLRADGTVRDIFHLAAKSAVIIGRDTGDWVFPYDQTMSGRHAEIRAADGALVIEDLGSRNGVAVAARGDRLLRPGTRVLAGDQVLRVEQV